MSGFTNRQASKIIGHSEVMMRKIKHLGLKPAGPGGTWHEAQVLGLAVRKHARQAGATKAAADQALRLMCFANMESLRSACASGKRFLRLLGDICDENTVTSKAAFDEKVMAKATAARMPYVCVDVRYWLAVIDEAKRDHIPRNQERTAMYEILHDN